VVHVRISEDTDSSRWRFPKPLNLTLIAISDFIRDKLSYDSVKLYDLYMFPEKLPIIRRKISKPVKVAIIGRITYSKGFLEFVELVERLQVRAMSDNYHFNLYGDLADDVKKSPLLSSLKSGNGIFFRGFVNSRDELYAENDIILHLSKVEPLGRIFFEAISFGKPLIGFNSGGIGEIGRLTGLEQYLVNPECENEADELIGKLEWARVFEDHQLILNEALKAMKKSFGHFRYVEELDNLLNS
jgi:glycosyltransferase involved in cell wall biosynthesis